MIIPREVFLKFYFDLLNHFREYSLNADDGEWKNKHGHQHKDDSKEWWFVDREINGRRSYVSLEITASASIYDNQIFFRIYGKYGIERIKAFELEWTSKEIRALGAALKYLGSGIPPDAEINIASLSQKESEVLKARMLFHYYLEYKNLNSNWPDFLCMYPDLNFLNFNKKDNNDLSSKNSIELREDVNAVVNSESVTSSSNAVDISLENYFEATNLVAEFHQQRRDRVDKLKEKFLNHAEKQIPKIMKSFFYDIFLGQLSSAFCRFHPDYRETFRELDVYRIFQDLKLKGADKVSIFDLSVLLSMHTIMGKSEDRVTAFCNVYTSYINGVNVVYSVSFKYTDGNWLMMDIKKET